MEFTSHVWFLSCMYSYHVVLPWHFTRLRIAPVPKEVSLLLPLSVVDVGTRLSDGVLKVSCRPPLTSRVGMGTMPVDQLVLHLWITDPHQVVQDHARCYDETDGSGVVAHGCHEHLKTVGKYAKRVLNDSPCPRQSIIEDPLFFVSAAPTIRFHEIGLHGEGVVSHYEERDILSVIWKWCGVRYVQRAILEALFQLRCVVDLSIGCCALA